MKKTVNNAPLNHKNKKHFESAYLICWIVIPISTIILLILDGLKLYSFNTQRLVVIGVCLLVVLIPFFNEITIKNFTFKK